MTIFLSYETDQSVDDMLKVLVYRETILFPSEPLFPKSLWEEVCDMTADDFRKMHVSVLGSLSQENFLRSINTVHKLGVENGTSLIRTALTY